MVQVDRFVGCALARNVARQARHLRGNPNCTITQFPNGRRPWSFSARILSWAVSLALAVLVVVPSAHAVAVIGWNPAINLRFSSGSYEKGGLKENPHFILAGHDLSGIGWSPSNFGVTLISPQHILTASHVAPLAGEIVSFCNRDGVIKHYTVDSVYYVEHTARVRTELALCRLTAPIPPEDHIGYFPTLRLPADTGYTGLKVFSFGQGQACGNAVIARWGVFDLLPFNIHDHVADDTMFIMEWRHIDGEAQAQGGDSGSPTFALHHGQLAIVGVHSAVDVSKAPYLSADVLVPAYFDQINGRLALDGFAFGNIFSASTADKPHSSR
jgi:hypothetical protein